MLTQSKLRAAIQYNPETGIFRRLQGVPKNAEGAVCGFVDDTTGYRRIGICGKQYYAHRLAWLYMTGEWPPHQIDHIDLDKCNNAWKNLRAATHRQNNLNHGIRKDNRTGFKGVKRHSQYEHPRWVARVRFNNIEHHLGVFDCPVAAHLAYLVSASRLHGEFARGR